MMIDLTDRVAVVTGGAQGIGRGICLVLAQQGASVAVADLNRETAESVALEISNMGRKALAIGVDVTNRTSVSDMAARVLDRFGQIDILANNAGLVGAPNWWDRKEPSDDDWDSVLAVNLRGVVNVSEAVAPHMMERRYGKIVNIASIAARLGGPHLPHYSASKAGVVSWTQSHALQTRPARHQRKRHMPRAAVDTPVRGAHQAWSRLRVRLVRGGSDGTGALREAGRVLDTAEEGADARGYR